MVDKVCDTTERDFIRCGGSSSKDEDLTPPIEPTPPPVEPPEGEDGFIVILDQPFYTSEGSQFLIQPGI